VIFTCDVSVLHDLGCTKAVLGGLKSVESTENHGSEKAGVGGSTPSLSRDCRSPRLPLRRVWLTKEEEEGYYYGFANEGLWPLCHIAHSDHSSVRRIGSTTGEQMSALLKLCPVQ
jgi:trehalose-6-phosphate synthase